MTTIAENLVTIPMLKDRFPDLLNNYGFIVRIGDRVVAVDCARAAPYRQALDEQGWTLTDILITHHHPDHVEGVAELSAATGAKVWGNAADAHRLPRLDQPVSPGDVIDFGTAKATVWDVSGHTHNHVAYVFDDIAFTGDSLMAAGCGRLFEGTPEQMFESLSKFADLPDDMLIASGHEYTVDNLRFALSLEPDNAQIISRITKVENGLAEGQPSVPSRLGAERHTNPFLRSHTPELKAATGTTGKSDVETFAAARRAKDAF